MKRAAIGLVLLAGCVDKPTSFGVNVEVITGALDDATRNQIVTLGLHVRGAETFDKDSIGDVGAQVRSGTVRFHYVPGTHAGSISFEIEGLDGASMVVASGAAPPVALVDGKAVDATVTLQAGAHNGLPGSPCGENDQCSTGFCADGVCCDTACSGTCESCALSGTKGTCAPIGAGTDPEKECPAKPLPMPDNLGNDDGGNPIPSDGGFLFPDGGAAPDPAPCAGTCSGNRSCDFPDKSKACGIAFCNEVTQQAAFVCDGTGGCGQTLTACGDYACVAEQCKAQCLNNNDCAPTDFCNVTTNKCVPKRDNGQPCGPNYECKSGFCIAGLCCNSDCTLVPGGTCNAPGTEGQCKCSVACDTGVGCRLWYKDFDGDTYGDNTGNTGNGRAQLGCESGTNAPPTAGFVKDNTDCDDGNANAHPGQTAFFQSPRTGGSYDYDCNGQQETYFNLVDTNLTANTCGFCLSSGGFPATDCTHQATCTAAGATAKLYCGFLFKCNLGGALGNYMFNTACGTGTNNYRNCGTCSGAGGGANIFTSSVAMSCR